MGDYPFQRGEERVFDTMDSSAARSEILLHLNDGNFRPQSIPLVQKDEQDCERAIVFSNIDNPQRTFRVHARIDSTKAGLKVVIYAKNVLLCHTEQRISFFYHRTKLDGVFDDGDLSFPLPVRDKRHQGARESLTMVTDGNADNEPTIYIREPEKAMRSCMTEEQGVKSGPVPINVPGSTGQFEIPNGDMLFQF